MMIPYFFRHYNDLVDRFFIFDNGSTDGTLEMLSGDERVSVIHWDVKGDSFVEEARELNNNFWKPSRALADWVFVVDVDEHLYHPDLRTHLANCSRDNATAISVIGYDMVTDKFPTEDKPLWQLVTRGIRFSPFDKFAIFDPSAIDETNYGPGRHISSPTGRVVLERRQPVMLLHYKRLGADYLCERNELLSKGLRSRDISETWGYHYLIPRDEIVRQVQEGIRFARAVPGLVANPATFVSLEDELTIIRDSGLFQDKWYLLTYTDVADDGMDPLEHFCLDGWREGRNPNPIFDSGWYLENYVDLVGDVNPLLDYVMVGEGVGRKPAPNFDPMEYRYRQGLAYKDSSLRHFLDRQPGALAEASEPAEDQLPLDFDPELYLAANPDVAEKGMDAGWHYVNFGRDEQRPLKPAGGAAGRSGARPKAPPPPRKKSAK